MINNGKSLLIGRLADNVCALKASTGTVYSSFNITDALFAAIKTNVGTDYGMFLRPTAYDGSVGKNEYTLRDAVSTCTAATLSKGASWILTATFQNTSNVAVTVNSVQLCLYFGQYDPVILLDRVLVAPRTVEAGGVFTYAYTIDF